MQTTGEREKRLHEVDVNRIDDIISDLVKKKNLRTIILSFYDFSLYHLIFN